MKLIKPYNYVELSLKDYYLKEIELEKAKPYIYMYYEIDGKNYMKQTLIEDAKQILEDL